MSPRPPLYPPLDILKYTYFCCADQRIQHAVVQQPLIQTINTSNASIIIVQNRIVSQGPDP